MNALFTAKAWLAHLWRGKRPRALHSPYLFGLFNACATLRNSAYEFASIEKQRHALLMRTDRLNRIDFGAGSSSGQPARQPSVSHIARHALSHRNQCAFLSRLARHVHAENILELGTSLGIMSAYLKAGSPDAVVTTVEGDPALAAVARDVWQALHLNIHGVNSTFESFFATSLFHDAKYDLVFIDGNHRSTAVKSYMEILLPHIHPDSIIVVDDIYWSPDMREGWRELIHLPAVTQSVDCFRFGMLFFRPDFLAKEHHRIILL
jgi:predicted O-methyltransferase YrrM